MNETYRLPVGKRSSYVNHAQELELVLRKESAEVHVVLRAYDDGMAFRYAVPGEGALEIARAAVRSAQPSRRWQSCHIPKPYPVLPLEKGGAT